MKKKRSALATVVIVCGPPKGCTCPAIAWTCRCAASKRKEETHEDSSTAPTGE